VSAELHLLNEEHQKLQTKFDAAKTRNKILSSELKGLKEQTKMLLEKGTHDDELIAALMVSYEITIACSPQYVVVNGATSHSVILNWTIISVAKGPRSCWNG
jgi:hypothetical protein